MTTLAGRRTEFETAATGASLRVADTWQGEPPYVLMFFDGSDLAPSLDTQVSTSFAVVLVVAKALDDVALAAVDAGVEDVYAVLRALDGWKIDSIEGLRRSTVGVDLMYTVTFRVSAMTELGG